MQPLERFPLDAAILFSDILTIPDAMGLGLYFTEGEGPRFRQPGALGFGCRIASAYRIRNTSSGYVTDAVAVIRRELDGRVPLIGFSGSPWTLATYMVEGGSAKSFSHTKAMLFDRPDLLHDLLGKVADSVIAYLNAQIARGAQAVMIFDTWGGALSPSAYQRLLAGLHATHRRVIDAGIRRPPGAGDPLHKERRAMAGPHGRAPAAMPSEWIGRWI